MRDSIKMDCEKAKSRKGGVMQIPIKELKDLEDTIVSEIEYNHHEFPGGCELRQTRHRVIS